jgi:hypothetical protein
MPMAIWVERLERIEAGARKAGLTDAPRSRSAGGDCYYMVVGTFGDVV